LRFWVIAYAPSLRSRRPERSRQRSAPPPSGLSADQAQQEQQNDRADRRGDQAADPGAEPDAQDVRQEGAEQGADQTHYQIGQQAVVPLHDLLGEPPGEDADDDGADNAYFVHMALLGSLWRR